MIRVERENIKSVGQDYRVNLKINSKFTSPSFVISEMSKKSSSRRTRRETNLRDRRKQNYTDEGEEVKGWKGREGGTEGGMEGRRQGRGKVMTKVF